MVQATRIAEVMGGAGVLGSQVDTLRDLAAAVSLGLPKMALRKTAQRVCPAPRDVNALVYSVVPEATYKRRSRLTAAESERTERLARVIALAEYVWDSAEDAREWLTIPHPELAGQSPLQRAKSELGAREVEELLDRIFYGLPA